MSTREIAGAIIDSNQVTNDLFKIETALFTRQTVRYLSRDDVGYMARHTGRAEWERLANAPALFVVIDGVRYRRNGSGSLVSFPMRCGGALAMAGDVA